MSCLLLSLHPPYRSTPFPYTTLFRSPRGGGGRRPSDVRGLRGPLHRRSGIARRLLRRRERGAGARAEVRSEEHTSELQSLTNLVCRLLLEKKKKREDRSTSTDA